MTCRYRSWMTIPLSPFVQQCCTASSDARLRHGRVTSRHAPDGGKLPRVQGQHRRIANIAELPQLFPVFLADRMFDGNNITSGNPRAYVPCTERDICSAGATSTHGRAGRRRIGWRTASITGAPGPGTSEPPSSRSNFESRLACGPSRWSGHYLVTNLVIGDPETLACSLPLV